MIKSAVNQRFIVAVEYLISTKMVVYQGDIAKKLEIKPSRMTEIMKGRMNVALDVVIIFCNEFGISLDWMFVGEGEMLKTGQVNKPEKSFTGMHFNDENEQIIESQANTIKDLRKIITLLEEKLDRQQAKYTTE